MSATQAGELFQRQYGDTPAGVWGAPGRVNLIGEHTDYNDGFVLPFALPHQVATAAAPSVDRQWTVHSEHTDETVRFTPDQRIDGWASYVAGVVWALEAAGHRVPPARLAITSDVPLGAGLSSSAALECAVLTALVELGDLDVPLGDRPALAQRAENEYVGMPCGIMDQSAATLSRAGHALFLDCRTLAVEHIPFELAATGLAILVVDTRAPHRLVSGEYAARRTACERAARALGLAALRDLDDLESGLARLGDETDRRRVRHVVTENQRVLDTVDLLRAGRTREIGPLMTASHASMRDDFEITVPEVDTAVETLLRHGALGARMTGGGFGGCVLGLVEADATESAGAAVAQEFARRGFAPPASFIATAEAGARRLA